MAKYQNPIVIDAALAMIQASTRVTISTAQPTTYAEAMTTYAIGTLAAASGNFTIANGDSSGRKITYGPGTIVVGTTGTVTNINFCYITGTGTLIMSGTCAPTAVTAGGTVVIAAWDVTEIGTVT